jgi:beta-lactamase regulating signal transducer with metallopeptidase domain
METLLELTLSGSVLALLLLGLRYVALRRMPSTVYYYAWLLVLLRFALPLPGLIPITGEANTEETTVYRETFIRDYNEQMPVLPQNAVPAVSPESQIPLQTEETQATVSARKTTHWMGWRSPILWLSLWACGTAVSLGVTVLAYLRFTVRLRYELHRPDRFTRDLYASIPGRKPALFRSDAVRTPLMFGIFSPKIVLPERKYDEELLRNILRHELMHYRRYDTLYKWAAVAILSAHWFNPLSWFIRKELNRSCELSCDEMLLRSMTREEKQSYGNTLLSMAAASALPAGVVATTFATEKRNLKERLVQIMNYRKSGARMLAAVLALALLAGCGLAAGPSASAGEASVVPADDDAIRVTNVDELLAAIAPNTVIELAAGVYDLSTASNYGTDTHSSYYSWNGVYSNDEVAAELVIHNVDGLTLRGVGLEETTIAAVPRYANVIKFSGCNNLTVANLTAGHTTEPGFCSGGVLKLENCTDVSIDTCGLYGCGTIGVDANDTNGLRISGCDIYECSYGAVNLHTCRDVQIENCNVHHHGTREGQGAAISVFSAYYSDGVVINSNSIFENATQYLLQLTYTKNAAFLSNSVHDNRFESAVFQFAQYGATVDGCSFTDNGTIRNWVYSSGVYANDITGKLLDASDFEAMKLREIDSNLAFVPASVPSAAEVHPGGEVAVTTIDELLAAIGPDRTIVLDGELFDLSTASNYGSVGGEYYYWNQSYDGPELVIKNVSGLSIRAESDDPKATTLAAIPRYANVLNFENCDDIVLIGFTAGHTKEPGSCSGGVLNFSNCSNVRTDGMRLYGCGILGIQASNCTTLSILRTEIYECSQGAGMFFQTDGINFTDCDVHDVPSPALSFTECGDKTWNGVPLSGLNGMYDVDKNGIIPYETFPLKDEAEFHGGVNDLGNPFAAEPTHHFQAGYPQSMFAYSVQQAIVEDDWRALADKISFPLQFFTDGTSFVIHNREDYLKMVRDGYFTNELFTDTFRFKERIAADDLSEFGSCIFGDTCLDHLIAFACFGDQAAEENLKITAISVLTPFWPGQAYVQAVPPTPQP